ncbi:MAG: hypothetical protein WA629_06310 [Candidatus Aquilonibacter sp.]
MLNVRDLTKRFRDTIAVDDLSFNVAPGGSALAARAKRRGQDDESNSRASTPRAVAFVALATATMFAVIQPARIPLYVLSLSSMVVVSRAIGVLGYALTPSLVDQRGPGMIVRLLLFYAASIPPAALGVLAGILLRNLPLGVACAALTLLAEGAGAIALATLRLSGRGLEAALAEAS